MRKKPFFSKPTPLPLRRLILSILVISLFCAALEKLFTKTIEIPGPIEFLSLSQFGVDHLFLWQPLTYLFLTPSEEGISFLFIMRLLFNLYLLWMVGISLIQQVGSGRFLRLFFVSGFLAGLVGLWIVSSSSAPLIISGSSPAIYAALIAWTMLFPELEILFFYSYPCKVKWLVLGFLALSLLSDLSDGHFVTFLVYFAGVIAGYLYSVLAWGLISPFKFTHRFDRFAFSIVQGARSKFKRIFKTVYDQRRATIYDIQTGEVIIEENVSGNSNYGNEKKF